MKILKKILCSAGLVAMAVGAGFSITNAGNNNVIESKADVTYAEEVYISGIQVEETGWCYMNIKGSTTVTNATGNTFVSGSAWKADNVIDFAEKIIFNNNGQQIVLKDVVNFGTFYWNHWGRPSSLSFQIDATVASNLVAKTTACAGGTFCGVTFLVRQGAVIPTVSYSTGGEASYMRVKAGCLIDLKRDGGVSFQFNETAVFNFKGLQESENREVNAYKNARTSLEFQLPTELDDGTNFGGSSAGSGHPYANVQMNGLLSCIAYENTIKIGDKTIFDLYKAQEGTPNFTDEKILAYNNAWAMYGYNQIEYVPFAKVTQTVTVLKGTIFQKYNTRCASYVLRDADVTDFAAKTYDVYVLEKDNIFEYDNGKFINMTNANIVERSITGLTTAFEQNGDPKKTVNIIFDINDSDFDKDDYGCNLFATQTLTSRIHLYDTYGQEITVKYDTKTVFAQGLNQFLVQLYTEDGSSLANKCFKVVIDQGALLSSKAFATTAKGDVYRFVESYTMYRFGGSNKWHFDSRVDTGERVDVSVLGATLSRNEEPLTYNLMVDLDENFLTTGTVTANAISLLTILAPSVKIYDKDGKLLEYGSEYWLNSEQYIEYGATCDFLLQLCFTAEAQAKFAKLLIEKGALIPSPEYQNGEGKLYTLNNDILFIANESGAFVRYVKVVFGTVETQVVAEGSKVTAPAVPAKDPTAEKVYTGFWRVEGSTDEYFPDLEFHIDYVFVADYKESKRQYTVSYLDEEGKTLGKDANFEWGSSVTVDTVPAKTGYNGSWEVTAGGVTIEDGKFTMPTANVTLKASYSAKSYVLSFEGIEDKVNVTYDAAIGTLPDVPAKTGYHDGKWTLNGEVITSETVWKVDNNAQAVASYTINTYTVTFDSNGGSAVDPQTVNYNECASKPADPTYVGKQLVKWTLNDEEFDFTTPITDNITLVAVWETAKFTVTFDTVGGSDVDPQTVEYGQTAAKPQDPVKAGNAFVCWKLDGAPYDFETPVTADITLVATWQVQTFTVTFDSDGGETVNPQTVEYGQCAVRPNDPGKLGFVFEGWIDASGALFNFSTPITANITLRAKWSVAKYTVSFDTVGGSSVAAQTVEHGKTATKPADPTRSGYTFKGWVTGDGSAFDFSSPVLQNLTVYASWEKNPEPAKSGCSSSVIASSAIIALVAASGIALLGLKKKED